MRSMFTAVEKYCGSSPGASTFISHGAARSSARRWSANTHTKPRGSFRNSAVRSSPCAAVSMGTKANTMLLISTEFSVSIGPMATASESA